MLEEEQESTWRPPGPRSRFGNLTPKSKKTSKLGREKQDGPNNSSLNVGDVNDSDAQNGQGDDASGVDGPVLGTASVSKTSAFRSFLAQRGAGSAAALALKDGFGRILNSSTDDKLNDSNQDRLSRGETIGEDQYQANRALSLEHGEFPRQGRDTSTKTSSRPSQLQQRLRNHRLNRSDPDLMRSKKKGMIGDVNRQQKPLDAARSPVSLSPVSSESSSTTSGDDTDGYGTSKPSSWLKSASRINKFVQKRGWGGRTTETTVPKGLYFPFGEGRVSLLAACRNIWRYLRGCGDSGKVVGPDNQAIPGVGRAASGRLENAAYERLGDFVGRGWPRKGLASFPMYHLEEHLQKHARAWRKKAAVEDAAIRIRVLGASILPEDPRITTPIIVVHIIDSSNGCYLAKTARTKDGPGLNAKNAVSDRRRSQHRRRNKNGAAAGEGHDAGTAGLEHSKQGCSRGSSVMERPDDGLLGGVSTTFERKTVWNLTGKPAGGEKVRTGLPCNTVPAIATQPSIMTMSSSTPAWDETFVFLERYHRLLVPECLLLFELVDFATAVPRKEARKGGGLLKIAWGFLRPIGAGGECNIDVRGRDDASPSCVGDLMDKRGSEQKAGNDRAQEVTAAETDNDSNRTATLQLFEYRPLSVQARWQARHRGFPRLAPPVAAEVPDVFLQFLLHERKRYPATLRVSVGPIAHPTPVWVTRRPTASYEHEIHRLSFKGENSAKRETKNEDGGKDNGEEEAGSVKSESAGAGAAEIGNLGAERLRTARSRRLREKNKPCLLPDRLLHRVYAGQNGAITLAFSESGALLAAACCDEPLLGRFPIRLFDSDTGRCRHELKGHASMVYSLVWSPGDSLLLSASADGTAKVWRIAVASDGVEAGGGTIGSRLTRSGKEGSPKLISVLQHAPPCFVYAAVFQPLVLEIVRGARLGLEKHPKSDAKDCALVVTGAYDRQLRLWDVSGTSVSTEERAKLLGTLSNKVVHESHVNAIVYDSRNGRLYSGDGVGAVVVWRRASGGRGGVDDYSVLRKVQHIDLIGKAITSLALAPRLRRGQLLVQAHGNTLRLLNLGTYKLVNPGFAGDSATGSLVRASFSPDGHFVVSGSEKGQVRVWDAQGGKRVRTPLQALGTACCLRDIAWHPNQHVLALAGYGPDSPILLYYSETTAENQTEVMEPHSTHRSSSHAVEVSAEEHRRSIENRQRLREIRIKRLKAKALWSMERSPIPRGGNQTDQGAVVALNALTVGGRK